MTYKIINATQYGDSINTVVELTIDNQTSQVTIAHFRPNSVTEIYQNIENRMMSEQAALLATATCGNIINNIKIGEIVTV